ncbi:unnamed protein product [marine sediment metagenome]|uniref:Uncharacterized protein n=1 Tax=marine sediment metagenome TaxID=412755 RepID=X1B915_9ZZZZ
MVKHLKKMTQATATKYLKTHEHPPKCSVTLFVDDELVDCENVIAVGDLYYSARVTGRLYCLECAERLNLLDDSEEKEDLVEIEVEEEPKPGRLFTDQQLIELYDQGLIDREIAEKLGVHFSTVNKHRTRLGLKAKGSNRAFTDQQLIDLYEQGFSDREIAEKLGVSGALVGRHRKRLGLEAIRKKG